LAQQLFWASQRAFRKRQNVRKFPIVNNNDNKEISLLLLLTIVSALLHLGLSRRLTSVSEPGTFFVAQLQQARYLDITTIGATAMIPVKIASVFRPSSLFNRSFLHWHRSDQLISSIGCF
jgi:hypothetical protein